MTSFYYLGFLRKNSCFINPQIFRQMDANNDMKVTSEEFINACLVDEKLMELLEGFIVGL